MNHRQVVAIFIGCLLTLYGYTQTNNKQTANEQAASEPATKKKGCSCAFSSINQLGFATGQNNNAVAIQTINGLRYKDWFAGIGVGLDFYKIHSIPVFVDIRRNLLHARSAPFIYADGGIHFPFGNKDKDQWEPEQKFEKGLYYDVGVGYNIAIVKKQSIVFSVGYSAKNYEEKFWYQVYSYKLNRAVIKIGWQF